MTYAEIIANIRDLGFSDNDEIEEFGELVPNAIERAVTQINIDVPGAAPRNTQYDFTVAAEDTDLVYVDMEDVDSSFMEFAETNMLYKPSTSNVYTKFTDFDIMNESTIILDPASYDGAFRVIYKKAHTKFTGAEDQLDTQVPLNQKVHHLVEFLAAYYVWLEDEPTKAAQYYNMYEQKIAEIKAEELNKKPRMRILLGGI